MEQRDTNGKMAVFVNHTNHPSMHWGQLQVSDAEAYGEIVDVPFPLVDPHAGTEEVRSLAEENLKRILELRPAAVLCQGEFTYAHCMVELLKRHGIPVLSATTERIVSDVRREDGAFAKTSVFRFVRFREY